MSQSPRRMVASLLNQATVPTIGPIRFSIDLEWETKRVLSSGNSFPDGVLELCAYWSYSGVSPDTSYWFTWYRYGLPIRKGEDVLESASGEARQYLHGAGDYPLEPGLYQLAVTIDGQMFLSEPCLISPGYRSGGDWTRCASGSFRRGYSESSSRIMIAGTHYAQGVGEISGGFQCYGMVPGTPYRATWYQNGQVFSQTEGAFDSDYGASHMRLPILTRRLSLRRPIALQLK